MKNNITLKVNKEGNLMIREEKIISEVVLKDIKADDVIISREGNKIIIKEVKESILNKEAIVGLITPTTVNADDINNKYDVNKLCHHHTTDNTSIVYDIKNDIHKCRLCGEKFNLLPMGDMDINLDHGIYENDIRDLCHTILSFSLFYKLGKIEKELLAGVLNKLDKKIHINETLIKNLLSLYSECEAIVEDEALFFVPVV